MSQIPTSIDVARPSPLSRPPITGLQGRGSALRPLFLPHCLAMLFGLLTTLIPDHQLALRLLCLVSVTYALYMVSTLGGAYLTPSGVLFLASGAFIGLASMYLADVGSVNNYGELRDWAVVAFVTTVASAIVMTVVELQWKITWPPIREIMGTERHRVPQSPLNFQVRALLMVGASQVPLVVSLAAPIAKASGLAGVMMLVLAASSRRVRMRWHGDAVLVALAVVVPFLWVKLEFEGGGRLTVAGLGVAALVAWNLVRPRHFQKIVVVLCIPGFLLFAGLNRLEKDGHRTEGSQSVLTSGKGLESMYSPLDTFTELATVDPGTQVRTRAASSGPRYGQTFLNTLYLPIPRTWWENKPKGFGAELTEILRPTLLREKRIAPEHSMAALVHGEFYVNFGYLGLVMLPFALGLLLAVLDRAHARLAASGLTRTDDWWAATILVCLVGSLGDLFWVGTFTFFARGGLAAIMAWALWRFSTRRTTDEPQLA